MKPENLIFLEPSGPLQACNGTDLPLPVEEMQSPPPVDPLITVIIQTNKCTTYVLIIFYIRKPLLSFGAEYFVLQFAIQKFKD